MKLGVVPVTDSTTQKLKIKTMTRILKYGQYGDSFDDVLNKILDRVEGKQK